MWHLEQSVMISYSFGIICWTNGLLLSIHSMTFQDIVFICLDCLDAIIDNSEVNKTWKKWTIPKCFYAKNLIAYLLVVIFFPLTNLVEVDELLMPTPPFKPPIEPLKVWTLVNPPPTAAGCICMPGWCICIPSSNSSNMLLWGPPPNPMRGPPNNPKGDMPKPAKGSLKTGLTKALEAAWWCWWAGWWYGEWWWCRADRAERCLPPMSPKAERVENGHSLTVWTSNIQDDCSRSTYDQVSLQKDQLRQRTLWTLLLDLWKRN